MNHFWSRTKISLKIEPEIQNLDLEFFCQTKNDKNFARFRALLGDYNPSVYYFLFNF